MARHSIVFGDKFAGALPTGVPVASVHENAVVVAVPVLATAEAEKADESARAQAQAEQNTEEK